MMIAMILFLSVGHCLTSDRTLRKNIGDDVTLSCSFENESQLDQVSFMHQATGDLLSVGLDLLVDKSLINTHMRLTRVSSNRVDLTILSIHQNDSGLYSCMHNDEKLSSFLLEIFIPPRFVYISPMGATFSYPEGSTMNLSCHADAFPAANITWLHRNKDKQSKTIYHGEDLFIASLESTDSGSYECVASNGYHAKISRSFYVTVQYAPHVNVDKFIDTHANPFQLHCRVCSMPSAHSEWFKNGNNITNDQHMTIKAKFISNESDECLETILTIHGSLHDKYGRYECRAENLLGHHSDHVDVSSKSVIQTRPQHENIVPLFVRNDYDNNDPNSTTSLSRLQSQPFILFLLLISHLSPC